MTQELQELRNQRLSIVNQMQDFATRAKKAGDEGDTVKRDELFRSFDKAEQEEAALGKQIQMLEKVSRAQKEDASKYEAPKAEQRDFTKPFETPPEYRQAFEKYFRFGKEALSNEDKKLLAQYRGTSAQSTTGNLGGYTIPTGFLPELIVSLKQYSAVIEACRVLRTDTGNTMYIPTYDDTSTSANLISEGSSITVQDVTFAQKRLDAYKLSTLTTASEEIMQDSAFDLEAEMRRIFSIRFGRAMNNYLTTGTGSSQPNGVVTAAGTGVTAAGTSAITNNDILGLIHSVDPAYRYKPTISGFKNNIATMSGNVGLMFNDSTLLAIKKLANGSSDARPLWLPSTRDGEPDTIHGYPYWINPDMAAIATGNVTILFGDFSYYVARISRDVSFRRLDERYADTAQVGFVGLMRFDGELLNSAAVKKLTQA